MKIKLTPVGKFADPVVLNDIQYIDSPDVNKIAIHTDSTHRVFDLTQWTFIVYNDPETAPAAPPPLRVCARCLMGIESHEGKQITREIHLDEDDPSACDWCEESDFDILYEIQ